MKISKVLVVTACMAALSISNFAMAKNGLNLPKLNPTTKTEAKAPGSFNVAVVDIQKVVESSPAVSALKTDRQNRLNDLARFVQTARADVAKEKDSAKQKALEDSYNKELNLRKETIDKDYAEKLADIDKSITSVIKAKTKAYDLVLTKAIVLNGGTDITEEIIKGLK